MEEKEEPKPPEWLKEAAAQMQDAEKMKEVVEKAKRERASQKS